MENKSTETPHNDTEEENLSDVCVKMDRNENQSSQKEKPERTLPDDSTEFAAGKDLEKEIISERPIEAIHHIVNIDETMAIGEDVNNRNTTSMEQANRKSFQMAMERFSEIEIKKSKSSSMMRAAGRSQSVRDHLRKKEQVLNAGPYLSASAPHLTTIESSVTATINSVLRSWLRPVENKMNIKVFGSKRAMKREQDRYSKAGFIVHPTSSFRIYWDIWILLLLMINIVVLPVTIAFFGDGISFSWSVFYYISDTAFLLDIVLNFRTGYLVHGSPNIFVLEPTLIAKRYLKTWFAVDLVSSLPFDYIVDAASRSESASSLLGASRVLRILRLVKLLSLLKLLRLSRLVRYVHQYEELLNITRSVIRFSNLISIILLVAHWNGCLQFLVPYINEFPDDSWVVLHSLENVSWDQKYCWSLFKALSHMLCIGYGRYPPQNIAEACVTIFSMMTGATFYALFIAICISFIQQLDSPSRQYKEKIQQVEEYMTYRKLPVQLRDRALKYYEHRFQGKFFDEEKILGEISRPLREKVINYNCRELVQSVPFFKDADVDFVSAIITHLKFEVYLEGDEIIREGELGTEMYFVKEGVVDVTIGGVKVNELSEGLYFGEICLLTNARRTACVTAQTVCDVFVLHAEDFRDVVDEFPAMRTIMEKVAEERMTKLGKPVDLSSVNVASTLSQTKLVNFDGDVSKCARQSSQC